MQVLKTRTPMLSTLYSFATRDGELAGTVFFFFKKRYPQADFHTGVLSLWSGLSASVLRQSTYSTARFGLYTILSHQLQKQSGMKKLSTSSTIVCAGVAGGLAGMVGNPTEVVLVRMCADAAKPASERFFYSDAVTALYRISREEGLKVFGRGLSANVVRSVLMSKHTSGLIQGTFAYSGLKTSPKSHLMRQQKKLSCPTPASKMTFAPMPSPH